MPKYQCIRDCFAYDRFHYEGRVYELPDVAKSPRNFRLVDEERVISLNIPPATSTNIITEGPQQFDFVTAPPKKEYRCPECGKVVRTAFGLSGHSRSHKKEVTNGNTTS